MLLTYINITVLLTVVRYALHVYVLNTLHCLVSLFSIALCCMFAFSNLFKGKWTCIHFQGWLRWISIPFHKGLLLKETICFLEKKIVSFESGFHFKGVLSPSVETNRVTVPAPPSYTLGKKRGCVSIHLRCSLCLFSLLWCIVVLERETTSHVSVYVCHQ